MQTERDCRESPRRRTLAFAHIGDLHINLAADANFRDLMSIIAQIETETADQLDFVFLPGDCADHGEPHQYRLIRTALRMLSLPVHVIPGDHDMEPGSLDNFHAGLDVGPLPRSIRLRGHRCLFLDFCSTGSGGPDFRLGQAQRSWIEAELLAAGEAGDVPVVFMHSYPADLTEEGAWLAAQIANCRVVLVDMGHTHYNELANDGTTVFAATRSTGQVEEGPVGYSVITLDDGAVGWRFRPLADPFPFVAITSPPDHRLLRDGEPMRVTCIRARVFGHEPPIKVEFRINEGEWQPMELEPADMDGQRCWHAALPELTAPRTDLVVRAITAEGRPGLHRIMVAGPGYAPPTRSALGGDADTIGAWPENGIPGTRLGPNRNGRAW